MNSAIFAGKGPTKPERSRSRTSRQTKISTMAYLFLWNFRWTNDPTKLKKQLVTETETQNQESMFKEYGPKVLCSRKQMVLNNKCNWKPYRSGRPQFELIVASLLRYENFFLDRNIERQSHVVNSQKRASG